MATTRKPRTRKPAAEAPEVEWTALLETALTAPGSVGNTYNRFYEYSFMNQMLLMMQGVQEPVATYKRWLSMGRQPIKGSSCRWILRPVIITKKDDQGEVEARFTRFKMVKALIPLSETKGEELPEVAMPEWDESTALAALDVKRIPFSLLDGNTMGYATPHREVAVNPISEMPHKVLMHELAHIVLGHTSDMAAYTLHQGIMEFQAEATALLVLKELELLTPEIEEHVRGYVQGWLRRGGEPVTDAHIRQVFAAVNKILKAGRPVVEATEEQPVSLQGELLADAAA